jgi:ubiquinone/menaquinone biosynthesis C-methylase UbiE
MPIMSTVEAAFCRSAPWRGVARHVVLPWAAPPDSVKGKVLEIGGGSGAMAAGLADRSPGLDLTVIDEDPQMVLRARRSVATSPSVKVQRGDVTDLPFADASFDTVLSFLMFHHVIGWEQSLTEVRRVLRPGGALMGYDLLDHAIPRLIHRLDGSAHRLFSAEALLRSLEAAGFEHAEVPAAAGSLWARFHAIAPSG